MDADTLLRVVKYHGPMFLQCLSPELQKELLERMEESNVMFDEKTKNIEKMTQFQREHHRKFCIFLATKAKMLYKKCEKSVVFPSDEEAKDMYAVLPPVEKLLSVPREVRRQSFFSHLQLYDIVIGKLVGPTDTGYILCMLCFDGGKSRYVDDLSVTLFLPFTEVPNENQSTKFETGNLIRGMVISYDPATTSPLITVRSDSGSESNSKLKLGLINECELPQHYKLLKEDATSDVFISLNNSPSFKNPAAVKNLAECAHLDPKKPYSFTKYLNDKEIPNEEFADSIRKEKARKRSNVHLYKGVDHFKKSDVTSAFLCINTALQIDPENVEAFVARGALYGNINDFVKATEDLEKALALNPNHENGKKNLVQILVVRGKAEEEKGDDDAALKLFNRAFSLDPHHDDARACLTKIEAKKLAENMLKTKAAEDLDVENKSLDELHEQKKKIKKLLGSSTSGESSKKKKHKRHSHHKRYNHHKHRSRRDSRSSERSRRTSTSIDSLRSSASRLSAMKSEPKAIAVKTAVAEIIDREVESLLSSAKASV